GNHAMTEFIVYNIKQLVGGTTKKASIIYDTNFYETTAEKFKKIAENIFDDLRIWSFAGNSNKKDSVFKKIIAEIRAEQSVGPIFFATESLDCSRLISMFKYPGTDYLVIGTSSLAVPTFIQQFEKKQLNAQEPLRDYTNGTFAVSPFISYLADQPDALVFREKFLHQYGKEPTWVAAAYYDAMLVALNAVEQAEILGESIREDRRRVRNALNRFNEKDVAVQGITGDLYFDENGNANIPLSLGIWFNHTFLPFYQQYQKQDQQQMPADYTDEDTNEDEEQYIASFRTVYAGVDINVIRNIDLKQGSFTADFYLWFRFKGILDDTAITFINAKRPVNLGKPIMEKINGDITTRAYRVIADLKIDSTKAFYPLDRHALRISFRHNKETRDKLIYIPDVIGVNGAVGKINRGENMLEKIPGWETSEISSRQHIEIIQDENKKNISYSRIDTEISIHRQEWGMLWGKILLPFLYIITLGCLILFISPERIYIRLFALFSLLFLAVNIRILYTYILPGQELTKYIFYIVVVLLLFSILLSGIMYLAHRYKYFITAKYILGNGILLYLVVVIGGITFLLHSHSYTPWSTKTNSVIIQQESLTWRVANKVQGTLDMLW
ncbi:hypothetical protein VU04_01180, partial [Desulfobulbus sp. TB]|nr:hypothetical protein [Desulfobulbus sp. TB]